MDEVPDWVIGVALCEGQIVLVCKSLPGTNETYDYVLTDEECLMIAAALVDAVHLRRETLKNRSERMLA